ncbi:NACHT domain-containing protein [Actinoplanes sp. NPDC048791]|uniref:NACHT domain-containing protein n=1 Tax=Actinoplanes sp. NPDC048791 TaxID=3154623 RepID=UPI0033C2D245
MGLDAGGTAVYHRVVGLTCEQLIAYFRSLPQFEEVVQTRTFWRVGDVARQLDALLQHQRSAAGIEDAAFAARYAEAVTDALGQFELFGVTRGRRPRRHTFDKYVTLAVARRTQGVPDDDEDGLTGVGIDVANALLDNPRVVIRAGAGAGKTTLLQWLAAKVADRMVWTRDGYLPFFVPLRQFAQDSHELPSPEQLPAIVARMVAGEMPAGWASRRFASGRALLLVDGVDELPPERREAARRWLGELVRAYPQVRFVVTSRPPAIEEDWLAAEGFVPFDLLSLSGQGIQDFLARWHEAAAEESGDEPGAADWLETCRRELTELIAGRPELRRLAASPLLAGLICALYQDRHMHLPRDRKSLYDAALELLLLRWDERRGVRTDRAPQLSMEEQVVILQRLAYSLVKNQDILLPRAEAIRRISHAMRGIRQHQAEPELVLQRTLERTGLLREVYDGQIQFVHRTFRDYLAAKEVVDAGDLGLLIDHAHLDQWHDVVIMAVAHARPAERERILTDLLRGNAAARERGVLHDRLRLVAAACLAQADVTDSDEIRDQVHQAARRLIPPATLDDAELLAKAGPFVLDLLPGPQGLDDEQAARVIRTAAMIGGEGARDIIARFTGIDQSMVIDELLRAWRLSEDPERYATAVLADVEFGDLRLEIQRWSRVQYLRHLTKLAIVSCRGDLTPLDPLAAIPGLRRLELLQNTVLRDLSPLTAAHNLRELHLASCPLLRDLSPLARTQVSELHLHLMNAPLETLGGAQLTRLVIRDRSLAAGLHPLPAGLPLTDLVLDNRPPDRNLRGIERLPALTHVEFFGAPDPEELAALSRLPALSSLTAHQPDTVDDLVRLPALQHLAVDGIPDAQQSAVLAALKQSGHLSITLNGETIAS